MNSMIGWLRLTQRRPTMRTELRRTRDRALALGAERLRSLGGALDELIDHLRESLNAAIAGANLLAKRPPLGGPFFGLIVTREYRRAQLHNRRMTFLLTLLDLLP